jgi:hypothetical protein
MSGPGPEHPEAGARFKFVRLEASDKRATYSLEILLPEGQCREGRLMLSREFGTAVVEGAETWTPWEAKTASALARILLKGGHWSRRLTRWKTDQ